MKMASVSGEAKLLDEAGTFGHPHPSVEASVIMIDKKTGGFRKLILSEERFDGFGKPQPDMDYRGQCTVVTP
jgi:hypothetical protein